MIRKSNRLSVDQHTVYRVVLRFSGVLVDDVKHLGKRPANGFTGRPPCKGFGHRVHDGDVAIAVYCYDCISYTLQRDL
jgi:hypothetical protein